MRSTKLFAHSRVDRRLATASCATCARPDAVEAALAHETAIGLGARQGDTAHEGIRRNLVNRTDRRR